MSIESTLTLEHTPARTTARPCAAAAANEPPPAQSTREPNESLARRITILTYGVTSYAIFFGTFLYACGFIANFLTPTALDTLPNESSPSWPVAVLINATLLLIFALQHSVMARPWFKTWWTRLVPEAAERSTYVLLSSVAMILMFAAWQPLGGVVWDVHEPLLRFGLYGLMGSGFLLVLVTTFLINHFDLFGLRQVWLYFRNQRYTHLTFKTPGLYSVVRHPLYVGWFVSFWATPTMTSAHLLFAVATTVYILLAIKWEERDLIEFHGKAYMDYRRRVPKLIPSFGSRKTPVHGGTS